MNKVTVQSRVDHTTVNLDVERRLRLMKIAERLGYVGWFRRELVGNMSELLRAIADGEVEVVRSSPMCCERGVNYEC
jgi:hypothetical protein